MTTQTPEQKLSRRDFLKLNGISAAGLVALRRLDSGFKPASAAARAALQDTAKYVYTSCVMCPAECGIKVKVENGVASAIYGNVYGPMNTNGVCAKGASGLQMVYNANRIKYPMIRVGERSEGKFKRVSWDEALDYIADKLIALNKEIRRRMCHHGCGRRDRPRPLLVSFPRLRLSARHRTRRHLRYPAPTRTENHVRRQTHRA